MAVKVSVYGSDKESDEYIGALKLKKIIQDGMPASAMGEIVLFASATLYGQTDKDIDLFLLGNLINYYVDGEFVVEKEEQKRVREKVDVHSFCTAIEIKRHDISGIVLQGTDFYVKYGKRLHCVTNQSNKQKISARNFFESALSFSPFVTNLIWFTQATSNDINRLLVNGRGKLLSNVLGADFDFKTLIRLLFLQKPPFRTRSGYVFDSNYESRNVADFHRALMLFSRSKEQMGELTRPRIERLTAQSLSGRLLIDSKGKLSIYRGRAGTGKTVRLIQTAIKLVDEEQVRVLILTYNRALVSDIRRLFALAELPDMFEENCVTINTMQSFFFQLANNLLYDGRMLGDEFLEKYDSILREMNVFLSDDDAIGLAKESMAADQTLDWDYVLIDEAQDWKAGERDVILKLFEKGKTIIADGGNQFVRRGQMCDWATVRDRNNIKLKYCLRQKENIVSFLNEYTQHVDMPSEKIISNGKMPGGKIIIISDNMLFDVHKREMDSLIRCGNIAYDMLYFVPHSLVKRSNGESQFALIREFERHNVFFWDGTNSSNRGNYSTASDEVRVLQYDSARGLEGWTVVCMDFDVFLEEKLAEYIEGEVDSLLLESPEEKKRKYIYNWAMIPFTRAIDTLVITIKDKESSTGKLLKEIANKCRDYVSWM